ncbi:MAG: hypothetical protein KDC98_24040 [Planctomycetes bacterium]|nr:hypothetical protein [Planctomycetota bacterium]
MLRAVAGAGPEIEIHGGADVRAFTGQLVRCYAEAAGLHCDGAAIADVATNCEQVSQAQVRISSHEAAAPRLRSADTLRSALAEALLSPEEFAALTDPEGGGRPNDSPD